MRLDVSFLRALELDFDSIRRLGRAVDNPKSRLQEMIQGMGRPTPHYQLVSSDGPDHQPVFTVQVLVGDEVLGQGAGNRKNDAERAAAQVALDREAAATARNSRSEFFEQSTSLPTGSTHSKKFEDTPEGNLCSLSSRETGKATSKRPTKASNAAGSAGSAASLTFFARLTWMKRFGKNLKKS